MFVHWDMNNLKLRILVFWDVALGGGVEVPLFHMNVVPLSPWVVES